MRPRKKPGIEARISAFLMDWKLIPPIGARGYNSDSWSRTKAFLQRRGQRRLPIGAVWPSSLNISAPKTRVDFVQEKTLRFRRRKSRISKTAIQPQTRTQREERFRKSAKR